jgi:hypothetical protein
MLKNPKKRNLVSTEETKTKSDKRVRREEIFVSSAKRACEFAKEFLLFDIVYCIILPYVGASLYNLCEKEMEDDEYNDLSFLCNEMNCDNKYLYSTFTHLRPNNISLAYDYQNITRTFPLLRTLVLYNRCSSPFAFRHFMNPSIRCILFQEEGDEDEGDENPYNEYEADDACIKIIRDKKQSLFHVEEFHLSPDVILPNFNRYKRVCQASTMSLSSLQLTEFVLKNYSCPNLKSLTLNFRHADYCTSWTQLPSSVTYLEIEDGIDGVKSDYKYLNEMIFVHGLNLETLVLTNIVYFSALFDDYGSVCQRKFKINTLKIKSTVGLHIIKTNFIHHIIEMLCPKIFELDTRFEKNNEIHKMWNVFLDQLEQCPSLEHVSIHCEMSLLYPESLQACRKKFTDKVKNQSWTCEITPIEEEEEEEEEEEKEEQDNNDEYF